MLCDIMGLSYKQCIWRDTLSDLLVISNSASGKFFANFALFTEMKLFMW